MGTNDAWIKVRPSTRTDYGIGVDFNVKVNDQFPEYVNDSNPRVVIDRIREDP